MANATDSPPRIDRSPADALSPASQESGTTAAGASTRGGESPTLTEALAARGFTHRPSPFGFGREIVLGSTSIGSFTSSGGWALLRSMPLGADLATRIGMSLRGVRS